MKFAHSVCMPTDSKREDGHAKSIRRVDHGLSETKEIVEADPKIFRVPGEMACHHIAGKGIMSGRHRCMGGKDVGSCDDLQCRVIIKTFVLDMLANALQGKKGRVALVHVINLGFNAKRVQGSDAANTESNFLPYPHLQVAAVQLFGDQSVFRCVLLNVGIEQVELYTADLQFPDLRYNGAAQN